MGRRAPAQRRATSPGSDSGNAHQAHRTARAVAPAPDRHRGSRTRRQQHDRVRRAVWTRRTCSPDPAARGPLPWAEVPITHHQTDRGHGRITTRTIQTLPAPPELPFPHVNQVWLIERYVTDLTGNPISAIAALGITNLRTTQATPAELATLVRNHWGVESLHRLRDTVYREDDSRVRTRSGPHVMAALRNLTIGALHLTGRRDIAEATR